MIAPQNIPHIRSIINSITLANVRSNQQIFKSSPPKYKNFYKFEHFKNAATPSMLNLAKKKAFETKSQKGLKRGFSFDYDNWYVNNMEKLFYPIKIEARRKFARLSLISKHHYQPQIIQFDVLDYQRWQANIEAKRSFSTWSLQTFWSPTRGKEVYKPRDHEGIPNATDNPLAKCLGQNLDYEYHVIDTLGWSLQLTNHTHHTINKPKLKATLKEATVLPITLLRQQLFGNQTITVVLLT